VIHNDLIVHDSRRVSGQRYLFKVENTKVRLLSHLERHALLGRELCLGLVDAAELVVQNGPRAVD
jgi:hypothetical protein